MSRRPPVYAYVVSLLAGVILGTWALAAMMSDVPPGYWPRSLSTREYLQVSVSDVLPILVLYGVVGVAFGLLWPTPSWQWGIWIGGPVGILFLIVGGWYAGAFAAGSIVTACLGAWVVSRSKATRKKGVVDT